MEKVKFEMNEVGLTIMKPTTKRNAPCTCGSGKKFKKCCINKIEYGSADNFSHGPSRIDRDIF